MAEFILANQFVHEEHFPEVVRVIKGGGMGLPSSGEISDMCLYSLCEKIWATQASVQNLHGILLYVRFKDDMFMIVDESRM